jgi:hypothetical protein
MGETRSSPNPPTSMLEDSQLVAFLKLKGHGIVAHICRDDPQDPRVAFEIKGDDDQIEKDVQSFYDNDQVGIQDYCRCLKEIKSQLYNTRRLGKSQK